MIYLAKSGDYFKIGYTCGRKADSRIKNMQTGNPYPITLVGLWEGSMNDEAALHAQFAHRRLHGEWFSLTADDIAALEMATQKRLVEAAQRKPKRRSLPPNPQCLPDLKFPDDIMVEVEGQMGCTWCGSPLYFTGTINYLTCRLCDRRVPMGTIICNAYRRRCVEAAMQACAI